MSKEDLRWPIRIVHIRQQIERIHEYAGDLNYDALLKDHKTIDALTRCVQIIGEAASKVPADIRKKYAFIPWLDIISMRHVLVHDYYKVDVGLLYITVTKDIPALEKLIDHIPVSEKDI